MDRKVFDWLGLDSDEVPYYLHPLNLMWSPQGVEHDLALFTQVALRLRQEPSYWRQIILDTNWRYTLVGCVTAMLLKEKGFYQEFLDVFPRSMVSPQVAVTLGLLHETEVLSYFEKFLLTVTQKSHPRVVISTQQVLIRLGSKVALTFDSAAYLDSLEGTCKSIGEIDNALAYRVVEEQWSFWQPRIGRL